MNAATPPPGPRNYAATRAWLIAELRRRGYDDAARRREQRTQTLAVPGQTRSGARVVLSFPGVYTKLDSNGQVQRYDFRVNIHRGALTPAPFHANVILDLYNKVRHEGWPAPTARAFLIELFQDGDAGMSAADLVSSYRPRHAPRLDDVEVARRLVKGFDSTANTWDWDLEELAAVSRWILLQEDLASGLEPPRGRFEGRRMAVARYIEAVDAAAVGSPSLAEVITRAEDKGQGIPLDLPFVDYGLVSQATFARHR